MRFMKKKWAKILYGVLGITLTLTLLLSGVSAQLRPNSGQLASIGQGEIVFTIGTADADAANIDVGIADDATYTNGGTEFFNDLPGETIAVDDSFIAGDGGTQTKWVLCQDSASATDGWVVAKILDNDGTSIAGSFYIEYTGK